MLNRDKRCYNVCMQDVQNAILDFTGRRDWDQFHSPENLAKSIAIESGELLECFQWNNDFDKDEVQSELADVMTYCFLLADKLRLDVREIIMNKLDESERKYPVAKAKGKSVKYTEL